MEKPPQSEDKIALNLVGRVMHEDTHDISDTIPKQTHRYLRTRNWSSPQKVVHLLVWEINPIRNMKGGLKWLRKDTNPKKS